MLVSATCLWRLPLLSLTLLPMHQRHSLALFSPSARSQLRGWLPILFLDACRILLAPLLQAVARLRAAVNESLVADNPF